MMGRPSGLIMIMPAQPPRIVAPAEHREARRERLPAERHVVRVHALVEVLGVGVAHAQLHPDERGDHPSGRIHACGSNR